MRTIDMATAGQVRIRRYAGRRLHDGEHARYVTLTALATHNQAGASVVVHEAASGEDVTQSVLQQIIFERAHDG